jgi:XTP/dITP diphosphohydrolase
MRLYLASGNAHKAAEFQAMADRLRLGGPQGAMRLEVSPASELGGMPQVEEDTGTFVGNAQKKAAALWPLLPPGAWAMADDSGLCVEALGGAPGVESAYYAGPQGDSAANLAKLVDVMRPFPEAKRQAEFVCVLYLMGPEGAQKSFVGRCPGRLAREPRGAGGFGYDPLFIPEGFEQSLAEVPAEVKNRISHRGLAWASCVGWLAARG